MMKSKAGAILASSLQNIIKISLLLLILINPNLKAQNLKGISYSNYTGTQGLYQNPASIADSRHKMYINIFTFDMHAANSFVRYNAPYSMLGLALKISAGKDFKLSDANLIGKIDGDRKMFSTGLDVRGPSFMYAIDDYNSFAFTTRVRSGLQINNMSEAVARLLVLGADSPELQDLDFFRQRFDLNINTFSELALSFATTVMDNGTSFLKAGLTLKRLGGIYSAHIINNEATYAIHTHDEFPDQQVVDIEAIRGNYGYTSQYDKRNLYQVHNWITGSNMAGSGFGMDAGFVYESRPVSRNYTYQMDGKTYKDNTFNKYNYRIGVSIMDLGGIRYKGDQVKNYIIDTKGVNLDLEELEGAQNTQEINTVIEEALNLQNPNSSFRSGLPTAININFDYKVHEKIYVTMVWVPGLKPNSSVSMRHNSFVAISPRYETKNLEFSLPISLTNNYHNISTGIMARVGPVFVGSDNIAGLLNLGNPHSCNLFSGLTIPIANRKLKDGDMDGISNKYDKCPNEKGLAKFDGCPDSDQDGIPDYLDSCPLAYGPKSNKGCPIVKQVDEHKEIQLSREDTRVMQETYKNLEFETGKAEIVSGSTRSLDKLAELLLKRPGYKLLIEGHTDNTGLAQSNLILSVDRANAVRDYLIDKGVDPDILIAEGHGAERPIADNETEEGRKLNRRVEFKIIQ
ncbi:MAG: DUF5723 family protein [Bacteroidota bacterium]|nr:DUF5723 family protein [Bacteroidota bacterium]